MPKVKKLPSGSWHCQVYSHTERTWNPGKKAWDEHRVYESFTGYDKKAVQAQAALFAHEKNRMKRPDRIKVIEAVQKYIDSKDGVLSPATIRGYQSILKNYLDDISQIELRDLTSEDLPTLDPEALRRPGTKDRAEYLRPDLCNIGYVYAGISFLCIATAESTEEAIHSVRHRCETPAPACPGKGARNRNPTRSVRSDAPRRNLRPH